jgi:hypothetical protein
MLDSPGPPDERDESTLGLRHHCGGFARGCGFGSTIPPVQPRFQSATELVTIDVVATRTDGQPASGLAAADFELFEDGVAQPIAAFQFVDLTTTAASRAPMGVSSNADEPGASPLDELGTLRDLATATGGRAIVNANDIDGAVVRVAAENRASYLAFGLGSEGGPPQRTWPAVVGRPLEPGLWRIAFTLNPPLPRGRADVTLLTGGAPLGPGCAAGFEMQ